MGLMTPPQRRQAARRILVVVATPGVFGVATTTRIRPPHAALARPVGGGAGGDAHGDVMHDAGRSLFCTHAIGRRWKVCDDDVEKWRSQNSQSDGPL